MHPGAHRRPHSAGLRVAVSSSALPVASARPRGSADPGTRRSRRDPRGQRRVRPTAEPRTHLNPLRPAAQHRLRRHHRAPEAKLIGGEPAVGGATRAPCHRPALSRPLSAPSDSERTEPAVRGALGSQPRASESAHQNVAFSGHSCCGDPAWLLPPGNHYPSWNHGNQGAICGCGDLQAHPAVPAAHLPPCHIPTAPGHLQGWGTPTSLGSCASVPNTQPDPQREAIALTLLLLHGSRGRPPLPTASCQGLQSHGLCPELQFSTLTLAATCRGSASKDTNRGTGYPRIHLATSSRLSQRGRAQVGAGGCSIKSA